MGDKDATLEKNGFLRCEFDFDGEEDCLGCNRVPAKGSPQYYIRTSWDCEEGEYFCRRCAYDRVLRQWPLNLARHLRHTQPSWGGWVGLRARPEERRAAVLEPPSRRDSMTAPDNHDELCKRLEAEAIDPYAPGLRHVSYVNPDGPEAAAAIRVLVGERDEMCDLAFTTDPENGQSVAWEEVAATQRARANAHLAARQSAEAALEVAVKALEPFARLQVPERRTGNAGAYMILFKDVERATQALASIKEKAGG